MSMRLNKFSSILCKPQEISKLVNNPFNVGVLNTEADSHALFRRDPSRLMLGRKKEALDEVFLPCLNSREDLRNESGWMPR
jgi:hypothetical protein